jgi:hypothetical protein
MTTENLKLTIELVPSTVWYASLNKYYKQTGQLQKWQQIKEALFAKEGRKCWICGKETYRLEAHESWGYDDASHVQRLDAIHHLCRPCHRIKHIGLWLHTQDGERMLRKEGLTGQDVVRHFCDVNKCSEREFHKHEDEAFSVWSKRSQHEWKQDFGIYEHTRK